MLDSTGHRHPAPMPDGTSEDQTVLSLHPLTLQLSTKEKEAEFRHWSFRKAYPVVIYCSLVFVLLNLLRALAFPELRSGCFLFSSLPMCILLLRVWCQKQPHGQAVFAWGLCTIAVLSNAAVVALHVLRIREPGDGMSASTVIVWAVLGFVVQASHGAACRDEPAASPAAWAQGVE